MKPALYGIFFPDLQIRLHFHTADPVEGHCVKFPDRAVIGRRIPGSHNHPSLRQAVPSEGLVLKKLQHGRHQRLRYTVDLIQE